MMRLVGVALLVVAASLSEARIHGGPAGAPVENHKNVQIAGPRQPPAAEKKSIVVATQPAVAKKIEPVEHAAVAAKSVTSSSGKQQKAAAEVMAQAALKAEVRSLFAAMRQKTKEPESFDKFMPRCLEHTKNLLTVVDRSYTDMQLEANLLHQCEMEEQFPTVYEDGFRNKEACEDFAKQLTEARMEELENGKTDGLDKFCADFYVHVYPSKKKKKEKKKSGAATVSAATALVIGATGYLL